MQQVGASAHLRSIQGSHPPHSVVDLHPHGLSQIMLCGSLLVASGQWGSAVQGWDVRSSLRIAGGPAVILSLQSYLVQLAYQNLPPVTFNLLNQSKMIFTALFVYIRLSRPQTRSQCFALALVTTTPRYNGLNG